VRGGDVESLLRAQVEGVPFVDAVANDPDDLLTGAGQRDTVALCSGNLGVHEDVLEFLLTAKSEGSQPIAGAAGADGEVPARLCGVEICLRSPGREQGILREWRELRSYVPFAYLSYTGNLQGSFGDSQGLPIFASAKYH